MQTVFQIHSKQLATGKIKVKEISSVLCLELSKSYFNFLLSV